MEITHVQGSHPLVFQGAKPAFDLSFAGGRVRLAIAEGGTDPCSKQFHLPVAVSFAIIEVKNFWPSILGNG